MNKVESWIKQHKVLTTLIVIFAIPFILIYKPYKATNPNNPIFIPAWFRLEDYDCRPWALRQALHALFPVGTDKKYVDLMLSQRGGADIMNYPTLPFYQYQYRPFCTAPEANGWAINAYFDKNNKLEVMMLDNQPASGVWIRQKYMSKYDREAEKTSGKYLKYNPDRDKPVSYGGDK